MKYLVKAVIVFSSFFAMASSPEPHWSEWKLDPHGIGCDLIKHYIVPHNSDPASRGILANSAFHAARVYFTAKTLTHGDIITADELGIIKFAMQIVSVKAQVSDKERISKVVIGGYAIQADIATIHASHWFKLSEKKSLSLLQRFEKNEIVDFLLIFESGEKRSFKMYPSGGSQFNNHVWFAMFKTCIKEHVRSMH